MEHTIFQSDGNTQRRRGHHQGCTDAAIANPSQLSSHSEPRCGPRLFTNPLLQVTRTDTGPKHLGGFGLMVQGVGVGGGSLLALSPGAWVLPGSQVLRSRAWAPVFSKGSLGNMAPDATHFTGLIETASKNLDRETVPMYKIVVETQDAQGLRGDSGTATVFITLQDVNDNFPVFTQSKPLP